MYKCEEHGKLKSEWCDKCEKVIKCDCSEVKVTRVKDIIYDSKNGERTLTLYIESCAQCGAYFTSYVE